MSFLFSWSHRAAVKKTSFSDIYTAICRRDDVEMKNLMQSTLGNDPPRHVNKMERRERRAKCRFVTYVLMWVWHTQDLCWNITFLLLLPLSPLQFLIFLPLFFSLHSAIKLLSLALKEKYYLSSKVFLPSLFHLRWQLGKLSLMLHFFAFFSLDFEKFHIIAVAIKLWLNFLSCRAGFLIKRIFFSLQTWEREKWAEAFALISS